MKKIAILTMLIVCTGCMSHKEPVNTPQQFPQPQKAPCAPNVTQEIRGVVHQTITEKTPANSSWGDMHKASCPQNMRTVLPSLREFEIAEHKGNVEQWYAEHEYCIPDEVKP